MQTSRRILLVLVAAVLAVSLSVASVQAGSRSKPKHISMVGIENVAPDQVDGFVQGTGPCEFRRPVALVRQPIDGRSRVVDRTTTNPADGRFSFERDFGTNALYQVLAPAVKRKRFVCASATSEFFGFFN